MALMKWFVVWLQRLGMSGAGGCKRSNEMDRAKENLATAKVHDIGYNSSLLKSVIIFPRGGLSEQQC